MIKKSQISKSDETDKLISSLLGVSPPKTPEPYEGPGPGMANETYQLPLKVGVSGQPLDDGDRPWIVGTFAPNQYVNETHPTGHQGVDQKASAGTPIHPIASGIVIETGTYPKSGNYVRVSHEDGNVVSFYAHMQNISVQKGQKVDQNSELGGVGDTGNAKGSGAHCHFEVKVNGSLVNPLGIVGKPVGSLSKKAAIFENTIKYAELFEKLANNEPTMKVLPDGTKEWYLNNHLDREDGPAIEKPDGTKQWYMNGKLHREDGPAIEEPDGSKYWYLNNKLNREDGPAIEEPSGTKYWYLNDVLHREDGPAIEFADGDKEWYLEGKQYSEEEYNKKLNNPQLEIKIKNEGTSQQLIQYLSNGRLHRENGPAVDEMNGSKEWWVNGKRHRIDGPAVVWADGSKEWWVNGKRHREDGPAIVYSDGSKEWWLNGVRQKRKLKYKPNPKSWTKILLSLGYTAVHDPGLSIVHHKEPTQGFALYSGALQIIDLVKNPLIKKENRLYNLYKKLFHHSWEDVFDKNKIDKIINNIDPKILLQLSEYDPTGGERMFENIPVDKLIEMLDYVYSHEEFSKEIILISNLRFVIENKSPDKLRNYDQTKNNINKSARSGNDLDVSRDVDSIETIKKYVGKPYYYIHFTNSAALQGLNPKSGFGTPIGFYGYPLTSKIFKQLVRNELPFATDRKHILVFCIKDPSTVLDFTTYSDADLKNDVHKLCSLFPEEQDFIEEFYKDSYKKAKIKHPGSQLFYITRELTGLTHNYYY